MVIPVARYYFNEDIRYPHSPCRSSRVQRVPCEIELSPLPTNGSCVTSYFSPRNSVFTGAVNYANEAH